MKHFLRNVILNNIGLKVYFVIDKDEALKIYNEKQDGVYISRFDFVPSGASFDLVYTNRPIIFGAFYKGQQLDIPSDMLLQLVKYGSEIDPDTQKPSVPNYYKIEAVNGDFCALHFAPPGATIFMDLGEEGSFTFARDSSFDLIGQYSRDYYGFLNDMVGVVYTISPDPVAGDSLYMSMEEGSEPEDIGFTITSTAPAVGVELSNDGVNWSPLVSETDDYHLPLYIRRTGDSTMPIRPAEGVPVPYKVSGSINALFTNSTEKKSFNFADFYYQDFNLVDASELDITNINLSFGCYKEMFYGCSSLVSAPKTLPAITEESFAKLMFSNCTSLVNAPALPAPFLTDECYQSMFEGCSSLVNAPALPATDLAYSCYESMFSGCSSLVSAPALPAERLDGECYKYMFQGCTSLVNPPALPAMSLKQGCYESMFSGCQNLPTIPDLPATVLVESCYEMMFSNCRSLSTADKPLSLSFSNYALYACQYMFQSCSNLGTGKGVVIFAPKQFVYNSCYNMFYGAAEGGQALVGGNPPNDWTAQDIDGFKSQANCRTWTVSHI